MLAEKKERQQKDAGKYGRERDKNARIRRKICD